MNAPASERPHPRLELFALGAVLIGAIVRLLAYAPAVSLWQDELLLSLNIAHRDFAGLMRPLAHDQAAPVLFLWLEHLLAMVGGVNEYALRLPALAAGVLLPLVIWRIGRRIVGEPAAVVATIFAAVSPTLISFSNQVKPYSSDALIAVLLAGFAWRVREQPASGRAWMSLAIAGVVAMLSSYPSMFTLAACGLFLLLSPGVLRTAGWRLPVATAGVLAIAAAVIYVALMRAAAGGRYLQDFWESTFLTSSPDALWTQLYRSVRVFMSPLPIPTDLLLPRFLMPVFLAGVAALWYSRGVAVAALCATGLVAALAASMAGRYPVAVRLFLFTAPFTFLIVGSVIAVALSRVERRYAGVTAVAGLLIALALLNTRVMRLATVRFPTEGRGAVRAITTDRAREPVYVAPSAVATWAFYSTDWTKPDKQFLDSIAHVASSGGIAFFAGPSRNGVVNAAEGGPLKFDRSAGPDLIGLRTGIPFVAGGSFDKLRPDSGWVETEVSRMLATCARQIWILSTLRVKTEGEPLVRALVARGGRVVGRFDENNAASFRVALPPGGGCAA